MFEGVAQAAAGGLALGLSTGLGCLGWCLPALGPYLVTRPEGAGAGVRAALVFSTGRLVGYAVVFALAAALGLAVQGHPLMRALSAASLLVLGALVLLYALHVSVPAVRWCRSERVAAAMVRYPLLAGVLVGLSPCPPLLGAAGASLGGSAAETLATCVAFFVGTCVFMLPLGVLSHGRIRRRGAGLAQAAGVLAGLWFVAHGVAQFMA